MKTTKLTIVSLLLILNGFLISCTGALTIPQEPGDTEAPRIILDSEGTTALCGSKLPLTDDRPGKEFFNPMTYQVASSNDSQEDLDDDVILTVTDQDSNVIAPRDSGGYIQTQGLMTFTWSVADAAGNIGTCSLYLIIPDDSYKGPLTIKLYDTQPNVMCADMNFLIPAVMPTGMMTQVGALFSPPLFVTTEVRRNDGSLANPQVVAELVVTDKDGNVIAPEDSGGYIQTLGLMTFTWTATDPYNNTGSCSLTMEIVAP